MGFFSGLKSKDPTFDTQRAVMTIVVAAIKADGEIAEEEVTRLRSMCARSPIFANNSKDEDDVVINFADKLTAQLKQDAVAKAAAALTPELRETAFAFACEVVLADGSVGAAEDAFIAGLAQAMGISQGIGEAIVNVTLIRLRGE